MNTLSGNHFLNLPRPDVLLGPPDGVPDTTTLAAHDFDVDNRTGFMPPHPPIERLPSFWEPWEKVLEDAISQQLTLGDAPGITVYNQLKSERWRKGVCELPLLPITELKRSEVMLRRAHMILAWTMHFFVHSLPPDAPICIPLPLTVPLLQVSSQLQLPPVLTYSDDVLYNWKYRNETEPSLSMDGSSLIPTIDNLACQTLFTGTRDEEEFYLTSARMELKGVEALELMRSMMDETFVGDDIAMRRVTIYLRRMAKVIDELRNMLLKVKEGCSPDVFYNQVRPWFRGADSDALGRKWVFEGIETDPTLTEPTELSGPSAGQSSLIHALDIFLGVDKFSHSSTLTGSSTQTAKSAFLERMQIYMPRHHRHFLNHLSSNPRPLRDFVLNDQATQELRDAYNGAVKSLKEFRDSHIIVVALYIISPARKHPTRKDTQDKEIAPLKGTGGTDMVKFLKDVRDQTAEALLSPLQ